MVTTVVVIVVVFVVGSAVECSGIDVTMLRLDRKPLNAIQIKQSAPFCLISVCG